MWSDKLISLLFFIICEINANATCKRLHYVNDYSLSLDSLPSYSLGQSHQKVVDHLSISEEAIISSDLNHKLSGSVAFNLRIEFAQIA
jgi:hypothetical protein